MNFRRLLALLVFAGLWLLAPLSAAERIALVTPSPSSEAVALFEYLQEISGKHTLSGQHCVPLVGSTRLPGVHKALGHYPAVFSQDFGFSEPGTWDGINYRQQIVDEAIRRHAEGFVITLMWHAVRPIEEEPVTFEQSIQGKLTDEEWSQLTTPGTEINERWKSQIDVIAFFLKQLRDARVPVLWRPYHEMNGSWFWWGGRKGKDGFEKLYRMTFDRLVNFHRLTNLIWVFGGNEVRNSVAPYAEFFPGHDVVDVLATDVYGGGYAKPDYDALVELAQGKPIGLGEVGPVPPLDKLQEQPRWTFYVVWGELYSGGGGGGRPDFEAIRETFNSDEVLNWEELPWVNVKRPTVHYPVLK